MIDIEKEIYTPIANTLRGNFPGADVSGSYTKTPSSFPHISIVEQDNYTDRNTMDSANTEKVATLMYEVNVYSNKGSNKKQECRKIIDTIDKYMYSKNFRRLSMNPVPNLEDATIYRIVARYTCNTDGTHIFRR